MRFKELEELFLGICHLHLRVSLARSHIFRKADLSLTAFITEWSYTEMLSGVNQWGRGKNKLDFELGDRIDNGLKEGNHFLALARSFTFSGEARDLDFSVKFDFQN